MADLGNSIQGPGFCLLQKWVSWGLAAMRLWKLAQLMGQTGLGLCSQTPFPGFGTWEGLENRKMAGGPCCLRGRRGSSGSGCTQARPFSGTDLSSVLQELAVPLLDSEECEKMYHIPESNLSGKRLIQADMLCAGFAEGQRDACQVTGAPCFPPWHPPASQSYPCPTSQGLEEDQGTHSASVTLAESVFIKFFF